MIVRPYPNWLRMMLVIRGSVILDIAPQLLFTIAFATLITVFRESILVGMVHLTFVPFSLIGLTLAIFLGFRNNTSYARYWEARMLWGTVLNDTRALTRQALTLVDDRSDVPAFVNRLIAFAYALRHQLRGTDAKVDLERLLPAPDCARLTNVRYKPAMLLVMAGEWLREQRRRGQLSDPLAQAIEGPLCRLGDALGGCERIAGTPIPFTYAVIIHRTVYLYCLLLPFGLAGSIGSMTPVVVGFVAYTFFALEALSAEIEDPFGMQPNDLPLDALCQGIEASLLEALGHRDLPAVPEPVDYLLT
ncbi:bestrophin family protein [Trinickia fusca]|uniref:Bestrophin n=1 Tax=Trinickia fusca TaxID=2419777 RepID=A0A494WXL1_9BURK|nr:bestrophin family ion channel [Trinickia fusca]RKP43298.1 hypothetical protein D7S89_26805 [Trinickia fusca]